MLDLIKFYNCFIRFQKFICLNILFCFTIFQIVKIPFYFFYSLLFCNVYYNKNDFCESTPSTQQADKACKLKEPKTNKSLINRTLLNSLIRKSMDKRFVFKYLGDYINKTDEMEITDDQNLMLNLPIEKQDNVILVNEVKSNTKTICIDWPGSIKTVEKTFLSLDNCNEINPNDGNFFQLRSYTINSYVLNFQVYFICLFWKNLFFA